MSRESKRRAARESQRTEHQASAAAETPSDGDGRTSIPQFLREVRGELKKVAWPNRKEVTSYTIVVLVTTLVLVLIVWGMDEIIRRAVLNTLG